TTLFRSRVELRIPRPACRCGVRVAVVDAVNAEPAELPGVVGIDQDHHGEQQYRAGDERAETGRQAAAPIIPLIRSRSRQTHWRRVLQVRSIVPADRGPLGRRATVAIAASTA